MSDPPCCSWANAMREARCEVGLVQAIATELCLLDGGYAVDTAVRALIVASVHVPLRHFASACGLSDRSLRARCASAKMIAPANVIRWAHLVRTWRSAMLDPALGLARVSAFSELRALRRAYQTIIGTRWPGTFRELNAPRLVQSLFLGGTKSAPLGSSV